VLGVRVAALTFDDGLPQHYSIAVHLHRMGVKASFLIPVGSIGWALTEEQVREIVGMGHELVSHSVTHRRLTELSASDLDYELKHSREVLESFQGEVRGFGYPEGSYNRLIINHVAKYYEYARSYNNSRNILKHPFTDTPSPYTLGAIDVREVKGVPYIYNKAPVIALAKIAVGRPLILVIHRCSIECVANTVRILETLGYKMVKLSELYEYIFGE